MSVNAINQPVTVQTTENRPNTDLNKKPIIAKNEADKVEISAKKVAEDDDDDDDEPEIKEASTGRKVGVSLASLFIPGLGQGINGQWGKAAGFFAASLALGIACFTSVFNSIKNGKNPNKGFIIGAKIASWGLLLWRTIDAWKNAGYKFKHEND